MAERSEVWRSLASRRSVLSGAASLLVLTGCSREKTAEPPPQPDGPPKGSLEWAVSGPWRAQDRPRDIWRHPMETLRFFGLQPRMTVVEFWPGSGWWTEILAPYLRDEGTYYIADIPVKRWRDILIEKLESDPEIYGKAILTQFGGGRTDIAPEGSADMILTFRNLHNWLKAGDGDLAFETMYKTLKPGGILGVVEHRANPDKPQDPQALSGYVREDYTIAMAERAGFKLVGKSEINANPKDTKDYPEGVWMLPPGFYTVDDDADREKYRAIGESDRFTLKFQKPER